MSNGQNIINKILDDAHAEANGIIAEAEAKADEILAQGRAKADKREAELTEIAKEEAKKTSAKQISSAQMQAKKMVLAQKQELIYEVVNIAKKKLLGLSETEYKVILISMLQKIELEQDSVIILSKKDKAAFGEEFSGMGFAIGDEVREIEGGFVVKNGDIEYNYSFESILTVNKEEIEQMTAEILFG